MQLAVAIDEPGRAGASDEDGPLLAAKGAQTGTEGVGGEPHARKGEGHGQHGVIAVGQLGGGERQPDPHPLLGILSQSGLETGLLDGGQHVAVGDLDAKLQIGAGGAPLAEQLAGPIPNAGASVGAAAIHPDPVLNHGGLPDHLEHSGHFAS